MKLIIDIPDEVLESKRYCRYFGVWSTKLSETIENGTPLPKGHDRLVEAKAVIKALFARQTIDDVPTIIEADKESENG